MKPIASSLLFLSLAIASCQSPQPGLHYPKTRQCDQKDTYFGTVIDDPYRWLENDRSAETEAWVKDENKVTYDYLSKIPFRDKLRERLTKIWSFEKNGAPFKKGRYYFNYHNSGTQNQAVLMIREGINGIPKSLLDPNTLSNDGTVALGSIGISKDGKYLAYATSKAGSDWEDIHVLEIESGKLLNDHLLWVKFSGISWQKNGFYYSRFDEPQKGHEFSAKNVNHKVYFHTVGTLQGDDKLVYEDKAHPERNFGAGISDDEDMLFISGSESTSGNSLLVKDLRVKNAAFVTIASGFENDYNVIDHRNGNILLLTNNKAPRYKLISVDISHPEEASWKDLIPQRPDLLEAVTVAGDNLIVKYLKDVTSRLYVYSFEGKQTAEIKPSGGPGMVDAVSGDRKDSLVFFSFTTFTAPATVFKYNVLSSGLSVYSKPVIDFPSDQFETHQVFYPSKDGTKIPMFITCKKGTRLDGNNPTFLFGYGGFNISYTPEFRIDRAIFLENGGVYAVANMRGGGEYGEDWHHNGVKCKKQNVFDDFIAAAEYLISEKYTSHDKLAIHGRSNGGLLIGAVMTQRPDLAKVAVPTVGVLDMLRYHLFTIGRAWAVDYGTSENKEEFDCLLKYSPLHNVKPASYPATLVLTGDHDDRVVPAHSFKFAATLQEKNTGTEPVLIRVDVNAGHGSGKPTSKQIDEFADMWSFVFYNLGMAY
ncbi:MAG TPA: prolyl oligopeptidase family serine peptidase [Bacteroidia bacterium]|jgi:prolyl oligopeptidase|nr:prolyl oligopeptidase family serine peptidase [Bacteroidia bacterium]